MMRPAFHYRPEANWINDPNGLCQVDGWYHLFYQYNPHGSEWGDIHWGHARSLDLVHWQDMPIAMTPDAAKGEMHCFSGSCCKDQQGRPHFFYTSIGSEADGRDCVHGAQQWMAAPVDADLTRLVQKDAYALTDAIHGGMHVRDWRDPCVFYWQGQYLMVLGGCLDGRGCVLLYTSPDMKQWTYRHVLAQSAVADGVPWECPNFFPLDGKFVLFYSPCAQVMVQVGDLDEELHFHCLREEVLDPGERQGYYAPQAFQDEKGRTILFGWMPECDGKLSLQKGWSGVMSLPRELRVQGDRLVAQPVEELCSLVQWQDIALQPGETLLAEDGRQLLLRLRCTLTDTLTLRLFVGEAEETQLTLTPQGELTLCRAHSSTDEEITRTPISRWVELPEGQVELFLALDHSTVECAVNGQWLSGRVYPGGNSRRVYLNGANEAAVQVGTFK